MAQNVEDSFYDSVDNQTLEYDRCLEATALDEREGGAGQEERVKEELIKLEEEIATLKSVLTTKVNQATELKRKLGITSMAEFKQDIKHGLQVLKESEPVQKTNEKLHQLTETIAGSDAYQKTNTAIKSFGAFASKKMGDLKNSPTFKSVEEKMGGAYSSIKKRVSGSQSEDNVDVTPSS